MDIYAEMAEEILCAMDASRHRPPHEELSHTLRGEMAVLRLLSMENRPLLAGDISKGLSMTTSRIAAVLNSLEKKALIVRGADADDRRRVVVRLTPEGEALCRERRAMARRDFTWMLEQLGEEDARRFTDLLRRVLVLSSQRCPHSHDPQGGMT